MFYGTETDPLRRSLDLDSVGPSPTFAASSISYSSLLPKDDVFVELKTNLTSKTRYETDGLQVDYLHVVLR